MSRKEVLGCIGCGAEFDSTGDVAPFVVTVAKCDAYVNTRDGEAGYSGFALTSEPRRSYLCVSCLPPVLFKLLGEPR